MFTITGLVSTHSPGASLDGILSIALVAELVPWQKVDRTQLYVATEEEETHSVVRCAHPHKRHRTQRPAEQVLLFTATCWHCFVLLGPVRLWGFP